MNQMERRLFLSGVAVSGAGAVFGQRVEVRKSGRGQIGLSLERLVSDGSAEGQLFMKVLRADLLRSGYFEERSGTASVMLAGRVQRGQELRAEVQAVQVADRRRLLGRAFSGPTSATRALAHRVADAVVLAATGMPGMASARLALVGNRSGHKELYVCDVDGANVRQGTKARSSGVAPAWVPGGREVLYRSHKGGYPDV